MGDILDDARVFCQYSIFIHIYRRIQMTRREKDEEREERINMEIIVDAYGPEEQAMGWYNYLDDVLQFPFSARCVVQRRTSPLKVAEEVKGTGMASRYECEHEMRV